MYIDVFQHDELVQGNYYWSYSGEHGPAAWGATYPTCASTKRQSPIDIDTGDVVFDAELASLVLPHGVVSGQLSNNGHTAVLSVAGGPPLSGGRLPGDFTLVNVHLHWGGSSTAAGGGSEHTVDGRAYPLEAHFVHQNTKYASVAEAAGREDGLAVLGVFYKVGRKNEALHTMVSQLSNIQYKGQSVDVTSLDVGALLPAAGSGVFRYAGSLTTPGCNEAVTWTVFREALEVAEEQLSQLRSLMKYSADAEHNEPLLFNFRPVQPLGNRTVSYSLQTIDADEHHEWGYEEGHGAATWAAKFPTCRGERQSPIDIDTEHVTYKEMGSPVLSGYYRVDLALSNNGHSAVASVPSSSALMFLDEEQYDLAQFHFHWGAANSRGSEHTMDGRSYPGELHLVHFKAAYGNLSEALKHADGLAVLGFFIEVGQKENAYLKPLSDRLAHVKLAGSEPVPIAGFKLQSLVEGRLDRFYRYDGSLTTPSCDEVVTWTVMKQPIVISQAQMNAFRQLSKSSRGNAASDPSPIGENYRPTQPVGSRTVYYNKPTVKQEEHTWTYAGKHGPASWSEVSEACVADRQSPINIDTRNLAYLDTDAPTLTGYDKVTQVVLKNNGHTIQCDVSGNDQYIEGGDLPGERFLLAQFHFHWGASNLHGSEHRVNGQSYPMEIHFVHYNSKYGSPSDALGHEDGLAVLGVFFEIDESDNEDFNVLIDSLREVQFAGSERPVSGLRLAPLLGSTDVFYRYKGSLTTPPCSEVVTWTVFQAPVKISSRQVAAFREMYSSERGTSSNDPELIGENFREVNPLGERVVYVNDMKAATVLGGGATGLRASLSFYGLVILMLTHLLLRSS